LNRVGLTTVFGPDTILGIAIGCAVIALGASVAALLWGRAMRRAHRLDIEHRERQIATLLDENSALRNELNALLDENAAARSELSAKAEPARAPRRSPTKPRAGK